MSLISTIKSILGMGDSKRADDGTTVTVEREAGGAAVDRSTAGSTDESGTEETPDDAGTDTEVVESEDERAETEEEQADEEAEAEASDEPVDTISGIGPAYAERLAETGIETVGDLAGSDAAAVADATDIAESRVRDWIDRAGSS